MRRLGQVLEAHRHVEGPAAVLGVGLCGSSGEAGRCALQCGGVSGEAAQEGGGGAPVDGRHSERRGRVERVLRTGS